MRLPYSEMNENARNCIILLIRLFNWIKDEPIKDGRLGCSTGGLMSFLKLCHTLVVRRSAGFSANPGFFQVHFALMSADNAN